MLFALLDAADDSGHLASASGREQWRAAKARLTDSPFVAESALWWELLEEMEKSGAIDNTWILDRWRTIKRQVGGRAAVLANKSVGASASHTPPFFARHFR